MTPAETLAVLRDQARAFERALPAPERKSLGQFFTGQKVGRLLAELAIRDDTARILDPMAGTGDLLDAVYQAAEHRGARIRSLDAIEIHPKAAELCEQRLNLLAEGHDVRHRVVHADAFSTNTYKELLPNQLYDLVIANPPYVRYQSMDGRGERARRGLSAIVADHLEGPPRRIWATLVANYSGLADLSVPAWLLCALLVRPGGRLALVTPATWRSRTYAQVVRYLMLRVFELEYIIEDTQPGWFPDALVRTNLVVAKRRADSEIREPLTSRATWPLALWANIEADAASSESLVGRLFQDRCPEAAFASWCRSAEPPEKLDGLSSRAFSLQREWDFIRTHEATSDWLRTLEPSSTSEAHPSLAAVSRSKSAGTVVPVPEPLRDLLPPAFEVASLRSLADLGICVGQGLRTGCNAFFYVELVGHSSKKLSTVKTSAALGSRVLHVPASALRRILHRQAEIGAAQRGESSTRLLDLRLWALPEDMDAVKKALSTYRRTGRRQPRRMPDDLARYVREAAHLPTSSQRSTPVAAMSAVRTNVRQARANAPPRFWYMLPDFMPRHCPGAFTPRVVHDAPQTYANAEPRLLIDANFSSLWSGQSVWSPELLSAFFNSVWCRALMEASGTRLGGGALKLEASHLRQLPLPMLDAQAAADLQASSELPEPLNQAAIDRTVLRALLPTGTRDAVIDSLATTLGARERELRRIRRGAPP